MRRLRSLLLLVAIVGAIALLGQRPGNEASTAPQPSSRLADSALPAEARATLTAIETGGPFRYDRDGSVFQNRERRLPDRPQGYYREYTVDTPGSPDRGARRIVTGGDPPEVYYYTDDHYRTFRRVEARDGR
jgi:ribonuclease T1